MYGKYSELHFKSTGVIKTNVNMNNSKIQDLCTYLIVSIFILSNVIQYVAMVKHNVNTLLKCQFQKRKFLKRQILKSPFLKRVSTHQEDLHGVARVKDASWRHCGFISEQHEKTNIYTYNNNMSF